MVARELPAALRYLKGVAPYRCAVFGCTSASAVNGVDGMYEIQELMQRELGCPAITVLGAVLQEIKNRGATRVAVLTPYTQQVNQFFAKTLEQFQVSVCYIAGMGLVNDGDIAALTPDEIVAYGHRQSQMIPPEADLCFFSCTNVRAAEVIKQLTQAVGKPVISSNQCVVDYIRRL